MFLGTHTPKLDEKGRFFLPAKFRDRLAGIASHMKPAARERPGASFPVLPLERG